MGRAGALLISGCWLVRRALVDRCSVWRLKCPHLQASGRGSRGRIKLDRLNVFHVDERSAAAALGARTYQHRELLILEANHLSANHVAVLQTNSVGECRNAKGQQQGKETEGTQKCFSLVILQANFNNEFYKSRLLLQAGEASGCLRMPSGAKGCGYQSCGLICGRLKSQLNEAKNGRTIAMLPIKGVYEVAIQVKDLAAGGSLL